MPGDSAGDNQNELGNGHAQQEGVQWAIALPSGSGLSRDLLIPATHCLPMPKSRGRKPKKNRAPATAAPKKRLDNFNNTPQVSPVSAQPAQEPPPATAPHQEQPTSKLKQIAMTLWRWLWSRRSRMTLRAASDNQSPEAFHRKARARRKSACAAVKGGGGSWGR